MLRHSRDFDLLIDRFHRREKNNLTDGVNAGQKHYTAVNANAETSRGRQAVFQGIDIVLVHHARFIVALPAQLNLLLEALLLVDWIVEFGESVAHLAVADKELEALCAS